MSKSMVGVTEATRGWQVSERTLRRRLSDHLITDAERDDHGQWLIPVEWLNREFTSLGDAGPGSHHSIMGSDTVIDLRDETVASGLAEALAGVGEWTNRVVEAEVRAALAESERADLAAQLRRTTDDYEASIAERTRVEHDLTETTTVLAVERERRSRIEAELMANRDTNSFLKDSSETELHQLREKTMEQRETLMALEAIAGRRKRRKLKKLIAERETGTGLR